MSRKWIALPLTAAVVALAGAGLTLADDDKESPTAKVMEKVQKHYISITKSTRTKVAYKKANDGKDVVKDADELVKLGKQAREHKGPSEKAKLPYEKYTKYMDDMIKASEHLSKVASDGGPQDAAKKAFQDVKNSCAACHKDFRPEDEDF